MAAATEARRPNQDGIRKRRTASASPRRPPRSRSRSAGAGADGSRRRCGSCHHRCRLHRRRRRRHDRRRRGRRRRGCRGGARWWRYTTHATMGRDGFNWTQLTMSRAGNFPRNSAGRGGIREWSVADAEALGPMGVWHKSFGARSRRASTGWRRTGRTRSRGGRSPTSARRGATCRWSPPSRPTTCSSAASATRATAAASSRRTASASASASSSTWSRRTPRARRRAAAPRSSTSACSRARAAT